MRIENWEKSIVIGTGERGEIREQIMHRRGEDPMVMAFRRNNEMAGCGRVRVHTEEAFSEFLKEDYEIARDAEKNRMKMKEHRQEWSWIGGTGKEIREAVF